MAPELLPPVAKSDGIDLKREVRAALKELKAGKTVAAYERLSRAVDG
jgi:hypothetical protein